MKFEFEYGAKGTWFNLFNKSPDYRGSYLYKSVEEDNVYLLIDIWTTCECYEEFKESNKDAYNKLSSQFKNIVESEKKIGVYNSII